MDQFAEELAFREVMITFASEDTRVRAVGQFLLTEHQNLVSDEALDRYLDDREGLLKDVGRYYALDQEGVKEAFVSALSNLGTERNE